MFQFTCQSLQFAFHPETERMLKSQKDSKHLEARATGNTIAHVTSSTRSFSALKEPPLPLPFLSLTCESKPLGPVNFKAQTHATRKGRALLKRLFHSAAFFFFFPSVRKLSLGRIRERQHYLAVTWCNEVVIIITKLVASRRARAPSFRTIRVDECMRGVFIFEITATSMRRIFLFHG